MGQPEGAPAEPDTTVDAVPAGIPLSPELSYRFERLDPALVRWSRFYNRTPFATSEQNPAFRDFKTLISASQGNTIPILVFEIEVDDDGHRYEAVYGHRRLEACRDEGCLVLAVIQEKMSAQEQGRLQLVENEGHSRLSVIERGKQIASQLEQGVWPNVGALAEKIGYTRTYAQHLKTIGEHIPDGLLLAHPDPTTINFRTAQAIVRIAKDDIGSLRSRIEVLRKERDNMAPKDATAFLVTGEIKQTGSTNPRIPSASLKRRRGGLQLTIQGLGTDNPEGLELKLREFLAGNGIRVDDAPA